MKIKDWLILAGSVLFAWLFYGEDQGANCAVFSVFILFSLLASNPQALHHKGWWASAASLLIAAGTMLMYGSVLGFFATIISLLLVAAYTANNKASAVSNFFQGGMGIALSLPNFFKDVHIASKRKKIGESETAVNNGFIYIIVIGVFLLFVLLYSASSTAFSEMLKNIDLKFISFGWIMLAVLGFFITYGLLKTRRLKKTDALEVKMGEPLVARLDIDEATETRQRLEIKAGTLLLALLNVLLLVVNASDIAFLSGGMPAPKGINFSEMVHQGIGALIASIIIAIAIIMYFFRGGINFDSRAKTLQTLALVWMAQNLVLIATGGTKNYLYTEFVDGLTYKRVGVYYYLLLSAIGLFFTALKIYARKPNWYLVRVNFIAFFIVMIASCPFDWDVIITKYNITTAEEKRKDPDIHYLLRLSSRNLPLVADWLKDRSEHPEKMHEYKAYNINDLTNILQAKTDRFKSNYDYNHWQSWNFTASKNYYYLKELGDMDYYLVPSDEENAVQQQNDTYNDPYHEK